MDACTWPVEKVGVRAGIEVVVVGLTVVVERRGGLGAPEFEAPAGRTDTTRATVATAKTT